MGDPVNKSPQQKHGRGKLILIVAGATALLALGGTAYWYASGHSLPLLRHSGKAGTKTAAKDAPPAVVFQLSSFVVNLADPDHASFLRIGIALGLNKPLAGAGEPEKDSPFTPRIRDAVLGVLSSWKSEDLLAPDGRTKLKKQLLATLQQKIPELGAEDVYITDFLIQR